MAAKSAQLGKLHVAQLQIQREHDAEMWRLKRAHRPHTPEPNGDRVWKESGRAERFKALSDAFLEIAVEAGPEGDAALCEAALAAARGGV